MKLKAIVFCAGLPIWAVGCSSVAPPVGVAYSPVTPATPPSTVLEGEAPPSAPPPAVSEIDTAVRREIHQTLRRDKRLSAASRGVSVTSDRGVVTLRGAVPSVRDRDEIARTVAQVPCVDRIQNELVVRP